MEIFRHLTAGPLDHELFAAGNEGQDGGKSWQRCVGLVRGLLVTVRAYGVTSYTAPDGPVL